MSQFSKIDLIRLREVSRLKWDGTPEGMVSLTTADLDFEPAPEILEGVKKALEEGRTSSGDFCGDPDVLEVVCEKVRRKNNLKVDVEDVCVIPGASVGVFLACWHTLREGDEAVIVPAPVHDSFYANPPLVGARVKESPARSPDFRIDPKDLEKRINRKTKLLMISNPHNPLGRVFTREELEALARLAKKHHLSVFSDELYEDLIYEGEHQSIASLDPEMAHRTLTLFGVSKAFNLSGLRAAYLVGQGEMMKKLKPKIYTLIRQTDRLAQVATQVALTTGQPWLEDLRGHLKAMRDYCLERMRFIPGLKCFVPQACPFLFVDIQAHPLKSRPLADYLEKKARVKVIPGPAFGPAGEGYIRINFATSQSILSQAFDRIHRALEELQ